LQNGGIERERVQLVSKIADINQHLAFYENIDIALDTFPYHGTTTTCEALWMGVPVITLAGKTHVARVGISILSTVGLEELIAESAEDYMQKAVNLAQNLEKLADLRQNLRQKMEISPLTNGKLFTESLENAYRQMWQTWCEKSANNPNLPPDNNLKNDSLNNNKLANISQSKPSIIVIDGVFFQMYKTGIGRVWRSLLTEWTNTDFANHILVLDRVNTTPKINGIRYRTIQAYDYENTEKDYTLLQKICDEEKAELFISSYYTLPISTPSVFMAYDMIPEVLGEDLNQPMWREKHKAINHASAFISISENTAKDLHKFFPKIPLESITVAHCGVDSRFCSPSITEINNFKYKYGIKQSYFLLENLANYKNSILFFKAFSQLTNKTNFDIVATGTGSQLPSQWRQYTAGCTFHQLYLTDEELRLAYGSALALVYPSQYEGFGMPVIEAMACGCPVITTPNSSLPEVAGKAAIYVKDDDIEAMANALCDVQKPSLRHHLIQAGLQQAQKFSWKKMAEIVKNSLLTVKNH
jgi:glycosyltransferase involved in cell wall biosynthesis